MADELETLRGLSRDAFGQSYRLELMLAIARSADGLVTLSDLANELRLGPSKIQGALSSLVAVGLLSVMPTDDARRRFLLRNPSAAWEWAEELATAACRDLDIDGNGHRR